MVEPVYSGELGHNDNPKASHWVRPDTGEVQPSPYTFGAGAMWYAPWLEETAKCKFTNFDGSQPRPKPYGLGPDGRILVVMTPGGSWIIDSRCRNCGRPNDDVHRCWIRHGTPPEITVDKNGDTCQAGAGSIQCGTYHGFLRGGYLVQA